MSQASLRATQSDSRVEVAQLPPRLAHRKGFCSHLKTSVAYKCTSWVLDRIYFRRGISILPFGCHFSVLGDKHWVNLFTTIWIYRQKLVGEIFSPHKLLIPIAPDKTHGATPISMHSFCSALQFREQSTPRKCMQKFKWMTRVSKTVVNPPTDNPPRSGTFHRTDHIYIYKAVQNNLKNIFLKPSFFFYPWLLWHSLTSWAALSYEIYCIWLYSHNSSIALPLSIASEASRRPFRFSGRLTRPQRGHTAGVLSAPHTLTHQECSVGLWVLIVSKCFYFSHNLNKTA